MKISLCSILHNFRTFGKYNRRYGVDEKHPVIIMDIILCKNESEKNKIGKTLTNPQTVTGTLREQTSITKPYIAIEHDDPKDFNYAYIEDFGRYYFVDDITVIRKGFLGVSLSVDVLESFKNQILQQNVIVNKSQSDTNYYLPDDNLKVNVKTKTDIVNFPNGFLESGEFILITAGG